MIRSLLLAGACLLGASSATLAADPDTTGSVPAPGVPVAAWPAPIRLPIEVPSTDPAQGTNELSVVMGKGLVKGTSEALSSIGQPLPETEGRNRTLEACKKAVWARASRSGGETIDVASDGRDRTTRDGKVFAPVTIRLAYVGTLTHEVRKSTVICVTDDDGNFLDAYTPEAPQPVAGAVRTP